MYELSNSYREHQKICSVSSRSQVPQERHVISSHLTVGAECLCSQAAPADSGLETDGVSDVGSRGDPTGRAPCRVLTDAVRASVVCMSVIRRANLRCLLYAVSLLKWLDRSAKHMSQFWWENGRERHRQLETRKVWLIPLSQAGSFPVFISFCLFSRNSCNLWLVQPSELCFSTFTYWASRFPFASSDENLPPPDSAEVLCQWSSHGTLCVSCQSSGLCAHRVFLPRLLRPCYTEFSAIGSVSDLLNMGHCLALRFAPRRRLVFAGFKLTALNQIKRNQMLDLLCTYREYNVHSRCF